MRFLPFRNKTRHDQLVARNKELRKQNHSLREVCIERAKTIDRLHGELQDERRKTQEYRKLSQDLQRKFIPTDNA